MLGEPSLQRLAAAARQAHEEQVAAGRDPWPAVASAAIHEWIVMLEEMRERLSDGPGSSVGT